MKIFAATKLTTLAIAIGVAAIVYMTPHKGGANINVATIEHSKIIQTNTIKSNSTAPEPATMLLFGAGLAGFAGVIRRKKK